MKRAGNSMIGLLVTAAIILLLTVFFLKGTSVFSGGSASNRKDGLGKTIPGAVKAAATDDVCRSNLNQVRLSLTIAHDSNGDEGWPATIQDTKIGNQFYSCPLGHEPYKYDPQTGTVRCVHLGHEKF